MPTITCVEDPSITYTSPPLPPVKKKKGLWIAFGENHQYEAQYSNGELLNGKGQPYEGEGVRIKNDGTIKPTNSFLRLVIKALKKITLAEQEIGTNMIETLQKSKFKFTIKNDSNKFTANQKGENLNYRLNNACAHFINNRGGKLFMKTGIFDTIGSGGMINWNGAKIEIITNKGKKFENATICLAHEMFHAYDANFGDLDRTRIGNGFAITEVCEGRAVYYCNQLRKTKIFKKKYLRLRYFEGDIKYNLLSKEGEPIYFPAPSEINKNRS